MLTSLLPFLKRKNVLTVTEIGSFTACRRRTIWVRCTEVDHLYVIGSSAYSSGGKNLTYLALKAAQTYTEGYLDIVMMALYTH